MIACASRAYLLYVLGCTLFADKTKIRVSVYYLSLLGDLTAVYGYAWGAAVLSYLYRQLGHASRTGVAQIAGYATLLQAWVYEHFQHLRPTPDLIYTPDMPRARRWMPAREAAVSASSIQVLQERLDVVRADEVTCDPYADDRQHPPFLDIAFFVGCLTVLDIVEPYHLDRALRQFGYVQHIPVPPLQPIRATCIRSTYRVSYAFLDAYFHDYRSHLLSPARRGHRVHRLCDCSTGYLSWFQTISHVQVQNPAYQSHYRQEASDHSSHLLDSDSAAPPQQAWRRRLNSHANRLKEFTVTFKEAMRMVRLGVRLWSYVREEASHGRKAPIDPFTRESCKPSASQGVPLGGMGSGSISRGFRGDFKHWQIIPGLCQASPVMANQFSIFISRDGGNKAYSSVLSPGQHEGIERSGVQGMSSWGWNLSGQHSTYHALFPRAWTIYDGEPDPELKISCRQISPFIPHNYQESSLPTSVFVYTLVNTGRERAKVSLLFTWANSIGGSSQLSGGHVNAPFVGEDGVSGVLLHHKTAKDNPPVTFAIAACQTQNVDVTVLPFFGLSEDSSISAKDMWDMMVQEGHFDRENFNAGPSAPSLPEDTHCAAVSASTWVEPHGKCTMAFALAWASPKVKFQKGSIYHRRYTQFYGTSESAAVDLVHDALMNYKFWEEEIEKWQSPILGNERLPEWYKFTLFNELYFLAAGGTVWIDGESFASDHDVSNYITTDSIESTDSDHELSLQENGNVVNVDMVGQSLTDHDLSLQQNISVKGENVGRFLYLEGVQYIMWCTYDVHFYASFALLALFPKIELSIQRDFAKAVLCEDRRKVKFLAEGNWGIRKVKGAVPHDLGMHDPWHEMNAYNIHDTSRWKDLNPKFVLQVYRDFVATGDMAFGKDVWPAVCAAMDYMEKFDRDGDGLIENDGFPDQTYDTWTVHGISAYCGCLWLAALQAAATMADRLGYKTVGEKYKSKFQIAKPVFEAKLWNGSYFNYDSGTSSNSKSIQADQLAGQWYAFSSGLPSLFDDAKIRSALQKIHDFNVMRVRGGRMGAVNGMHPNGKVDETCMQSREIWAGVTYGVAATMIHAGMEYQGFTTAEGIFNSGWSEDGFGYWFQTPEGWTIDGHYRSLMYMRPLAVWAMQWALSPPKAILEAPRTNIMDRICTSPYSARTPGETGVRKTGSKKRCFVKSVFHCDC